MFKAKEQLLASTILLAVAIGTAHAAPFDSVLVIAQASQTEQEKEKKPPHVFCTVTAVCRTGARSLSSTIV
jgi:hypothetical protein